MTDFEKAVRDAEIQMQKVEMIDAAPSAIRALQAKRVVRAVLMAVREPNDAMIEAGYDSQSCSEEPLPRPTFTAMIDAILAEGEGR